LATDSRRTARHHLELDQRYRLERYRQAVAQAHARGRAVGNLVVVALAVIACLMAAHALHAEQRQQQQLERLR
jgi:cell division septation protein DedD